MTGVALLAGCVSWRTGPVSTLRAAQFEPATNYTSDLAALPKPKGRITIAVYSFKDQTGQYKQAPESSFSTAVSQGGAAMLVKALRDSGWFDPVEREGLQDLLTERKIFRAVEPGEKLGGPQATLPSLLSASVIMEGAVVGYDYNVSTGGIGAKYLGIGVSEQYRKDQVTVNLRAVNTNNGKILHSITTTKTVYSQQVQPGIYRFISSKELFEAEAGYTYNEPVQLAVQEAIESAVLGIVVEGISAHSWVLADEHDLNHPLLQRVRTELAGRVALPAPPGAARSVADSRPAPDAGNFLGTDKAPAPAVAEPPPTPLLPVKQPAPPATPEAALQSVLRQKRGGKEASSSGDSKESFHSLRE